MITQDTHYLLVGLNCYCPLRSLGHVDWKALPYHSPVEPGASRAVGAPVPGRAPSLDFAFQWEVSCSCLVWPDPLERQEHHSDQLPEPHGPEDQWPQACQLRIWHWGRWAAGACCNCSVGNRFSQLILLLSFWSPIPRMWGSPFKNYFHFHLIHNCFSILLLYVSTYMKVPLGFLDWIFPDLFQCIYKCASVFFI